MRPARLLKSYLPRGVQQHMEETMSSRDTPRPEIPPAVRAHLKEVFREDILALQDLIGRDLTNWLA
jgi:hypothetical protein